MIPKQTVLYFRKGLPWGFCCCCFSLEFFIWLRCTTWVSLRQNPLPLMFQTQYPFPDPLWSYCLLKKILKMYLLLFPILFFLNIDCLTSFLKWQLVNFSTCLSKIALCWGNHPNPEITENLWHFLSVIKYTLSITRPYLMHLKCVPIFLPSFFIFASKNLVQKTKGYRKWKITLKSKLCASLYILL